MPFPTNPHTPGWPDVTWAQDGGLEMEDAEIEEIAVAAKGLSGSDLKEVCSQAQMRAVVDLLKGEKERAARGEERRGYSVTGNGDVELSAEVRQGVDLFLELFTLQLMWRSRMRQSVVCSLSVNL